MAETPGQTQVGCPRCHWSGPIRLMLAGAHYLEKRPFLAQHLPTDILVGDVDWSGEGGQSASAETPAREGLTVGCRVRLSARAIDDMKVPAFKRGNSSIWQGIEGEYVGESKHLGRGEVHCLKVRWDGGRVGHYHPCLIEAAVADGEMERRAEEAQAASERRERAEKAALEAMEKTRVVRLALREQQRERRRPAREAAEAAALARRQEERRLRVAAREERQAARAQELAEKAERAVSQFPDIGPTARATATAQPPRPVNPRVNQPRTPAVVECVICGVRIGTRPPGEPQVCYKPTCRDSLEASGASP